MYDDEEDERYRLLKQVDEVLNKTPTRSSRFLRKFVLELAKAAQLQKTGIETPKKVEDKLPELPSKNVIKESTIKPIVPMTPRPIVQNVSSNLPEFKPAVLKPKAKEIVKPIKETDLSLDNHDYIVHLKELLHLIFL